MTKLAGKRYARAVRLSLGGRRKERLSRVRCEVTVVRARFRVPRLHLYSLRLPMRWLARQSRGGSAGGVDASLRTGVQSKFAKSLPRLVWPMREQRDCRGALVWELQLARSELAQLLQPCLLSRLARKEELVC